MNKSVYADNKLHQQEENSAWSKLFELVPGNTKVLDIGCSSGNFGKELITKKHCTVVGVEINEADLKIAKRQLTQAHKLDIEKDDATFLGTFDRIIMADVIEHLINPTQALGKAKKLLKPNGKLIFSVPNMANISTRIELLAGRFEYTAYGLLDETHLHYYDRIELEKVLYNAGFSAETYNNTIREVPQKILREQLKSLGLTPQNRFLEVAQNIDAITFQFIGVAAPSQKKHAPPTSKTPYDFMSRQLEADKELLAKKVNFLSKELQVEEATLLQLTQQNADRKKDLQAIYESKGWRLLTKFYTAKHKLRKLLY